MRSSASDAAIEAALVRASRTLSVALCLVGGAACQPEESAPPLPPNIVLVTIDTLRADHLPFYGYARNTMPRASEWAHEAVLFENAYSPIPLTDPTLASLMTGVWPIRHGIRQTSRKLGPDFTTLAELLRAASYGTGAFVSRNGLLGTQGMRRGFGTANFVGGDAPDDAAWDSPAGAERWQRRAGDVTDAALAWLELQSKRPFFLWLHYFDPHAYYDAPAPFRGRFEALASETPPGLRAWWGDVTDLGATIAAYDEEILTVDHHLGRVVDLLRRKEKWESTLFVLTADHGESLGDRGYMDHGEWLHQEQVRVPLLIRLPDGFASGLRIRAPVRLIDVAPTLLELAGIGGELIASRVSEMDGRSFARLIGGESEPARRVFIESENCRGDDPISAPGMICHPIGVDGKVRALIDDGWKLILTPRLEGRVYELYDLEADPGERTDLSSTQPDRVREMESVLDEFWRAEAATAEVDEALAEQLRALGYSN